MPCVCRKGMETEQSSIYFILMKQIFLLKEWLQSHISFKAITKSFRNPQVEEMWVHFVTEINIQGWFITMRLKAGEIAMSLRTNKRHFKALESWCAPSMHWVGTLLSLCPSVLGAVCYFSFFLVAHKIMVWLTVKESWIRQETLIITIKLWLNRLTPNQEESQRPLRLQPLLIPKGQQ